ncbi:hypothetical protein [Mycobacterium sp. M26]|uniref:alpha/beta hydrolase family protein n=1 Tax=Mycobacterium sp. M26 TaxID=1762962 RepID=UPI0009EA5148|nr:hypothetical protein [Mycobacterium sp. M26]
MPAPQKSSGRAPRLAGPRDVTTPFRQAREFLRQPAEHHDELPLARPTLAVARQVFNDELVILGMRLFTPVGDAQTPQRIDREVDEALQFYGDKGWLDNPEGFFETPPPLTDVAIQPVTVRRTPMQKILFDSSYEPREGEPGRQRWLDYTANRREHALLLRHPDPRPWVVCVHGALMGRGSVDLRLFRAQHLHQHLGLNVVLPVMPLHGPRKAKGAAWPGQDVLDDVHAAAQAVWDIRRVISWIRSQDPDAKVGINGMSLGGYVSGLVASVEEGLACAVLGVPVANLLEVLGGNGGLSAEDPRRQTLEKAMPLGRMVSPLSLTPKVPPTARFIYGGLADRLVNPREQVLKLWEHWGRPEVIWYPGAHTGFFRSRPVQDFVDDALRQSGLVGR